MLINLKKSFEETGRKNIKKLWKCEKSFIFIMLGIVLAGKVSMSESLSESAVYTGNVETYSRNNQTDGDLYSYNLLRSVFKPKSKEPQPDASSNNKNKDNERNTDTSHQDRLQSKVKEELADYFENPSKEEAERHIVWIEVPVWRLKDGKKVSDTERIQVLNVLASDVKEIFREIYNGHEKFPIKRLIGYAWRGENSKSFHNTGRAIDINPEENPQIDTDGRVLVGKEWEPHTNPYSIKPNGDVVKAFRKRGWVWGENFRRKDYMHFGFREM